MNMPKFALLLLSVLAAADAAAFQIGQLTLHSYLGERLDARVSLFGVVPADVATVTAEVKPAIALPSSSAARNAAAGFTASVTLDEAGQPYLSLRSTEPVSAAAVDFRLRVAMGPEAAIAHFSLNLAPRAVPVPLAPVRRPTARMPQATQVVPALALDNQQYGPVRPGQSLWRILSERSLGKADRDAIIARIVAANPQAFVAGNPDRLRVGAMLSLPTVAQPSNVTVRPSDNGALRAPDNSEVTASHEVASIQAAQRAAAVQRDAALAARLANLSTKFADIKARYTAQDSSAATAVVSPPASTGNAPMTFREAEAAATAPTPVPAREVPAVVPQGQAGTPQPSRLSGPIVLGTGALISALALIGGLMLIARGNRRQPTPRHITTTDQQILAEITRKTEKRVLLEDTVKRSLGERRSGKLSGAVDARATELRAVDHRIAHGQYAEAQATLRSMIADSPQDFQAKLRLAEIHYLDEDSDAFVALADELYRLHRTEMGDGAWQRIMRMGRMLAPDRPPFSGPIAIPRRA